MSEKIVIKIGGDLLKENLNYVISDLVKIHAENKKIILCHAGADIVTTVAEKMGKPQIFTFSTKGYKARYVDEETRDIYLMVVAGLNNKRIVKEMISQKRIDAKVRDYVILYQEISPEKKKEELNKIKKEIKQKVSQSDNLIKIDEFSSAIKSLDEVKETARIFGLLDILKTAETKIKEIKKLEIERKKEFEEERIKEELQSKILEIENCATQT